MKPDTVSRPKTVKRFGSDFPSRQCLDLNSPAELAIRSAINEVEHAGCHPFLTDAVNLLQQAREKVADFIEREGLHETTKPRLEGSSQWKLEPWGERGIVQVSPMTWDMPDEDQEI